MLPKSASRKASPALTGAGTVEPSDSPNPPLDDCGRISYFLSFDGGSAHPENGDRQHVSRVEPRRSTLICIRADSTRTWSKVHEFFPIHDLSHYTVESILGFREAFFGLVASGWNIDTFGEPGARKRMPVEAMWAETIVGLFDLERGMNRTLPAEEFNKALSTSLRCHAVPDFRSLTEDELASVRTLRRKLQKRWLALAPGETLELPFPATGASA